MLSGHFPSLSITEKFLHIRVFTGRKPVTNDGAGQFLATEAMTLLLFALGIGNG